MRPPSECKRRSGTLSVIEGGPRPRLGPSGVRGPLPGVPTSWAPAGATRSGTTTNGSHAISRARASSFNCGVSSNGLATAGGATFHSAFSRDARVGGSVRTGRRSLSHPGSLRSGRDQNSGDRIASDACERSATSHATAAVPNMSVVTETARAMIQPRCYCRWPLTKILPYGNGGRLDINTRRPGPPSIRPAAKPRCPGSVECSRKVLASCRLPEATQWGILVRQRRRPAAAGTWGT